MKKSIIFFVFFLISIHFIISQDNSDRKEIADFARYKYESILNRNGCKFDFFETREDAIQYGKFLFQQDKNTDKKKDYDFYAYDVDENWMICIIEKTEDENNEDFIVDKFSDENEYIIIFKKGSGEVLRFERY